MNKFLKTFSYYIFPTLLVSGISFSCANRGAGPQGGQKDTIPPRVLKTVPLNRQLNFSKNKVEIDFDEIVLLEKPHEKVVVSPPQKNAETVKAYGKKVIVQFNDSMIPNKTYTIDFADAIVDNNEKNPLKGYEISFATGKLIDTLMISGILIDAETLNPCFGILVGIYENMSDTAFTKKPFERIAKTNENGRFCIRNIEEYKAYHLFALQDMNGSYSFDQPTEKVAFNDTVYRPLVWTEEHWDTVHIETDSIITDSVFSHRFSRYEPTGVLLKLFQEDTFNQYFIKAERREPHKFTLFFNETMDTMPGLRPLNFDKLARGKNYLLQTNNRKDTLTYWITDSLIWKTDTLSFALSYPKTDSLGNLQTQTDTLNLSVKREKTQTQTNETQSRKKGKGKKDKDQQPKIEFLPVKTNIKGSFDVYKPIEMEFAVPIKSYDINKIHLEQKVDTLWNGIPFDFQKDTLGMKFKFYQEWEPEKEYRLTVDSAAFHEYYGKHNNKQMQRFKIRSLEEYANLYVQIPNFTGKERILLLNSKEKIIREVKAEKETAFEFLEPGDYYLKLYVDRNGNGKWDTGKYETKTQPEEVFFYPNKITLRAFWDVEEEWDYKKTPLLQQKPRELFQDKNKKR